MVKKKFKSTNKQGEILNISNDKITGKITRIHYSSETFTAGKLLPDGEENRGASISFSIKGLVKENEYVTMIGQWTTDPKYGKQFTATGLLLNTDLNSEGLRNYLASEKSFKYVGPVKAKMISEKYADNFDEIIRNSPELIAELVKISLDDVLIIQEVWIARAEENGLSIWLSSFDLTPNQIKKIWDKYGNNAKNVLTENPYLLCRQIDGFGFLRTDSIALKMGIAKDHPGRIQSCLLDLLHNMGDDGGHTFITESELIRTAVTQLAMDTFAANQIVSDELQFLINNGDAELCGFKNNNNAGVADKDVYEKEMYLGKLFKDINFELVNHTDKIADLDKYIMYKFPTIKDLQATALKNALTHRISLMTGEAGTGKTFTINAIRETFLKLGLSVALAAPTGKAAKRMQQMTNGSAATIHRLLEYSPKEGFAFNADHKLFYDVIIIDEFSMVDIILAWHLFTAIDFERTQVILVGDHQQLPPVGAGNILRDLINNKFIPTTILNQVVRQAGILKENSTAILQGKLEKTAPGEVGVLRPWYVLDNFDDIPDLLNTLENLIENKLIPMGINPIAELQILTPYNKGLLGVQEINKRIQKLIQKLIFNNIINSESETDIKSNKINYYVGDKVMQNKNNYKLGESGVMNGTTGVITEIGMHEFDEAGNDSDYAPGICINFDDELIWIKANGKDKQDINLAYAISCHKAQGSEVPVIISIIHSTHSFMLSRNLIYTAITRAKKSAIILGNSLGIRRALSNVTVNNRRTLLSVYDDIIIPEIIEKDIEGKI